MVSASEREQLRALGADLRYVAHGGGCVAYFNYIMRLLDTRRTILVLTNCGPITPAAQLHRGGIPSPRIRTHQVAEFFSPIERRIARSVHVWTWHSADEAGRGRACPLCPR